MPKFFGFRGLRVREGLLGGFEFFRVSWFFEALGLSRVVVSGALKVLMKTGSSVGTIRGHFKASQLAT